jgi:aquaporin Z
VAATAAHARCRWRTWGAEAAGTALMVLAIVLAAAATRGAGSPRFLLLGAIVAPCVALIAASPLGRLSGAHINPAVTLGFWTLGRVPARDVAGYVSAQLAGGYAGALAAFAILPAHAADSIGGAVTHPSVPVAAALALEAGMTAALLLVIFGFVSSERRARWTPLAVAPLLVAIIWLGSPWTGASLNPARSEGPALAFGDVRDLWIYFAAPCAAALVTGLMWRCNARRARRTKSRPPHPRRKR